MAVGRDHPIAHHLRPLRQVARQEKCDDAVTPLALQVFVRHTPGVGQVQLEGETGSLKRSRTLAGAVATTAPSAGLASTSEACASARPLAKPQASTKMQRRR